MKFFFFNDTATTEIYTLSLHDALPISHGPQPPGPAQSPHALQLRPPRQHGLREHPPDRPGDRSEEHTSELQSRQYLVCRLLLEKKKQIAIISSYPSPQLTPLHTITSHT